MCSSSAFCNAIEYCGARVSAEVKLTPSERLTSILAREISYVPSTEFDAPDADERFRLGSAPIALPPYDDIEHGDLFDLNPFSHNIQAQLFRRMNYLKFFVVEERKRLAGIRRITDKHIKPLEDALSQAHVIRNLLVRSNARLVRSLLKPDQDPSGDLLSEMLDELLSLVERFDYERGNTFTTLAKPALAQCLSGLRKKDGRLAQHYRSQEDEFFLARSGHEDTADEAAEKNALFSGLITALDHLDARERDVIERRFGLNGHEAKTTREIAADIGSNRETVRQVELAALAKLRLNVISEGE